MLKPFDVVRGAMRAWVHSRVLWRTVSTVALAILLASPVLGRTRQELRPDLEVVHPVLVETLEASGVVDAAQRETFVARFDALAGVLAREVGPTSSAERKAKRLHRFLHRDTFRLYRADADGLPSVFDRGEYNCVSASLLEALFGRALGLDTWIVAGPRHVFLRVQLKEGRSVDIEATAPDGYDARRDAGRAGRLLLAYKLATPDEISARGARALVDSYEGIGVPVPVEHAPAFVWYNSGQRALARGDALEAARCFGAAQIRHPDVAVPREESETAVAHAFRIAYDAGRFDEAYRIAIVGVDLAPDHVSVRDRLIAAAVQRIELAEDSGKAEDAEAVLVDVRDRTADGATRFERRVIPGIVAAAIRVGDRAQADRLTRRYAEIEPDPVEVRRLARWVATR